MRLVRPVRKSCDRARFYASLRLDGELSELESRLLAAHLEQCGPCRAFGADLEAFTAALRAAPSDDLARPVEIPWRRRSALRLRSAQLGAAALALVAVGLGGVLASLSPSESQSRSAAPSGSSAGAPVTADVDELVFEEKLLLIHAGRSWVLSPVSGTSSRAL